MKKSKNEDNFSHADGENQNKTKKPEKIYSCKKNNDTSSVVHYIPDSKSTILKIICNIVPTQVDKNVRSIN